MPPSLLFHLEPMGLDSGDSECLTSYLSRLAQAHVLPLRDIVLDLLVPKLGNLTIRRSYTRFFQEYARSMNGVGEYAESFSSLLGKMTLRPNLDLLTMFPWKEIFDQGGKGLIRPVKAWCPQCFLAQRESGIPPYEPLRWQLSVFESCPTHKTPLTSSCPSCRETQPALGQLSVIGRCVWCGTDLGEKHENIHPVSECDPWQEWLSEKTASLFRQVVLERRYPSKCIFLAKIARTIEIHTHGNAEALDRRLEWGTGTLTQWRRGRTRPRFDTFMTFCYRLQIDPVEFLFGLEETDGSLGKTNQCVRTRPVAAKKRSKKQPTETIRKGIELLADLYDEELSLAQIAKNLDVGIGYLRYRFPEESQKISDRYKEGILIKSQENFDRKAASIVGTIQTIIENGDYPSKMKVFAEAPGVSSADGRNPKLAGIWRVALEEIRSGNNNGEKNSFREEFDTHKVSESKKQP